MKKIILLSFIFSLAAWAQITPFPPNPSGGGGAGTVGVTVDSGSSSAASTINFASASGLIENKSVAAGITTVTPTVDTAVLSTRANAQAGADNYMVPASGSATAYAATPTLAVTAYTAGMRVYLLPDVACTGGVSTTLNISSLGAKRIFQNNGTSNPTAAQCLTTSQLEMIYDPTLDTAAGGWRILSGAGGSVTNVATGTCLTGGTITTTGSISFAGITNPQTSTYQVLAADFSACKTIPVASGTFTITLVASGSQPNAASYIRVINYGSGVVTIARSGQNINGGTSSLTLPASSATAPTEAWIMSDGTNYFAGLAGTSSTAGLFVLANNNVVTGAVQQISSGGNSDELIFGPGGGTAQILVSNVSGIMLMGGFSGTNFYVNGLNTLVASFGLSSSDVTAQLQGNLLMPVGGVIYPLTNSATGLIFGKADKSAVLTLDTSTPKVIANAQLVASAAGASATPELAITGAIGAFANTAKVLVQATGTTAFAGSANGTEIGANCVTGATGNLFDGQLAGVSKGKLSCAGDMTVASSYIAGAGVQIANGNTYANAAGSYLYPGATTGALTGTLRIVASGGTTAINFGGDTSSFPALKRSTTTMQVRLADDSGYATLDVLGLKASGAAGFNGTCTVLATVVNGIITAC